MDKIILNSQKKKLKMKFGKKSILLTLAALLISLLFFIMFSGENYISSYYASQSTNTRINTMNTYVKGFSTYASDALDIATYSALHSLYLKYSALGVYSSDANNFNKDLINCIQCGAMSCSPILQACTGMEGKDMTSLLNNLTSLASVNLNIETTFKINSITIIQDYPFDIDVKAEISYTVSDKNVNYSTWNRIENITTIVSIIGLNDPLIGISSKGVNEKKIIKSTICQANESCWDLDTAKKFYTEQTFRYTVNGTSFLSRYWNSTNSSSCCGIESFMNVSIVGNTNASYLDHYYYSGVHTCYEDIILEFKSIDSGFKLDSLTAGRYDISDDGTLICRP